MGRRLIALLASLLLSPAGAAVEGIVTADILPMAYHQDGKVRGMMYELVQEMAPRLGFYGDIKFYPWPRAQATARSGAAMLIFPVSRTPEREKLYTWVAPFGAIRHLMLTRRDLNLPLDNHAVMGKLPVGVLRGSPHRAMLENLGYRRILEEPSNEALLRLLDQNMVAAIVSGDWVIRATLQQAGRDERQFVFGTPLSSTDIYIAASLTTPEVEVLAWRQAIEAARRDGVIDRLMKKYGVTTP